MIPDPEASMAAYHDLRERVTALLGGVADDRAATTLVAACPGWTVTDTAAHMCGVTVDIVDGNLEGVATDPWTASHVERLAPLGLSAILERWTETGAVVESLAAAFPPAPASQMVFDATTHEHDIRGALGDTGGRESTSIVVGLGFMESSLDTFIRAGGLPALGVHSPQWTAVMGEGEPEVEVETSTFELFRTFGGRRSEAQIRSLPWTGDPGPYLAILNDGPVILRAEALIE